MEYYYPIHHFSALVKLSSELYLNLNSFKITLIIKKLLETFVVAE